MLWVYFSFADNIFGEGGSSPGELWCHEVLEPWSESTLTWTNKPDYGPPFDGWTGITNFGLLWCDVTALVAGWASGQPNYGVALTNPTDRVLGFYSMDAPSEINPNYRPGLVIETVPIGQADADADGILDTQDNCSIDANEDQRDTDQDGYGNLCDADLDGDGVVTALDFSLFRAAFRASRRAARIRSRRGLRRRRRRDHVRLHGPAEAVPRKPRAFRTRLRGIRACP